MRRERYTGGERIGGGGGEGSCSLFSSLNFEYTLLRLFTMLIFIHFILQAPDLNLSVFPLDFSLTAPKLSKADGLHLLRGEDGEIGISFDKRSSRHFFFLGKAPTLPKFSLGLKVLNLLLHDSFFIIVYTISFIFKIHTSFDI